MLIKTKAKEITHIDQESKGAVVTSQEKVLSRFGFQKKPT